MTSEASAGTGTGVGPVLVTGGSGFVAVNCVLRLLSQGYRVRATVRTPRRERVVRAMLRAGGAEPGAALSFAPADLTLDAGWAAAVDGCEYVLHVASPFPPGVPRYEDELIIPAREGALRVLRAARDTGVRRVVLTSSFAAVGYGPQPVGRPFTEEDWTDPDTPGISAYARSKILAERAAWDFLDREGGGLELSVINPVGIFGPVLGQDYSSSIQLVRRLLDRAMPGVPRLSANIVDVRDVADLHLRAMRSPAARGERFLAVAGAPMAMRDIARLLRHRLGRAGARVPTRVLPDWVVRLGSLADPSLRQIIPELGRSRWASADKARRVLGWMPRTNEEALLATAQSLIRLAGYPEPAARGRRARP